MGAPIELLVLIMTLLLVCLTWLLYRLADKLRMRP
jgi:cbb3-type cytochrome oxidase subunit 3